MSVASPLEQAMLTLINQERTAAGVAPLQFDNLLNDAAEDHSSSMLVNNIFSHTGADGSTARERMIDAGYVFSGTNASGENIAYQSERGAPGALDDVQDLHDGLMRSPGHRANILNPNFDEIGIGIEEGLFTDGGATFSAVMVTQNFGLTQANDIPGAPTPTPTPPTETPGAPVDQPPADQDNDAPTAPPQPETPVADGDGGDDKTPVQPELDDDEDIIIVDVPTEDTDMPVAEDDGSSEGDVPTGEGDDMPFCGEDKPEDIPEVIVTDLDMDDEIPGMNASDNDQDEDGAEGSDEDGDADVEAPAEGGGEVETPVAEADAPAVEDDMPVDADDDAPTSEDDAPQSDEDEEFDFAEGDAPADEGGEADAPVWTKTHDDDTYAKVITDFTADCNDADAFAALDTELQLFVVREFDCAFDMG